MQGPEEFKVQAAEIAFHVVALAVETALKVRSAAAFRSSRAVIEGQLDVLRESGYGDDPSEQDLVAVRQALQPGRGA